MKPTTSTIDTLPILSPVLHAIRLHLLKVLLGCGISALSSVWIFEAWTAHFAPINRIAYPTMIAIFSLSLIVLFRFPDLLERIEQISFATFAIYIVLRTQSVLYATMDIYAIASLTQWFPLVYTAAFFFFSTRRAIFMSILIYLSVFVPYALDLVFQNSTLWASDSGMLILNMVCSQPVYIVILSGIANLKTHLTQVRAHADVLNIAASVDYLTGVANRRAASRMLQNALCQTIEARTVVSVILIDIDHFKAINDGFGHDIGDKVLVQLCAIIQERVRATDVLARWGGEEFLIIVNTNNNAEAVQLAERLRVLIAQHTFEHIGELAASFGVATALPYDTLESLVKRADEALYRAKQCGRNRVEVAIELANA